jgi:TolB-like protein/tetratricopeptide (TPR) repeat protein
VLPLRNLSGDPEQEYFADGMTEALITDLAKIGALKVIARHSAMRYKGTDLSSAEIASELGVDAVVEGSAQRVGGSVRIMAQLIDPRTEQALWAESYERDLENVLVLQGEVARAIAGEVVGTLTPEEAGRLAAARPVNPEAHDFYLKGSFHWKRGAAEDFDTAQRYFELALEKDPSYAPAYEGLAWVWTFRRQVGLVPPDEAGAKAKAAALQAVALDDSSAGAHEALAVVRSWIEWDWEGAEPEWRRALELDPKAANTHAYFAQFLATVGRTEEAVSHSERAIELDPFNALFHGLHSMVLYFDRRYDDAIVAARNGLAIRPDEVRAHATLGFAFLAKGMRDEHLAHHREWVARDPVFAAVFEQGLAEAGYEGAHRGIADLLAARWEESGGVPGPGIFGPAIIAWWYLFAGDHDRAMDWLERGFEAHDPGMPYVAVDPLNDPLRPDPRFQDLLRRMNMPQAEVGS